MSERHNTKIAVFGGKPGEQLEYKGATYVTLIDPSIEACVV